MYYILNSSNQPEGPFPADWIRSHAGPETLVSNGQTWVAFAAHPDFVQKPALPMPPPDGFCADCRNPVLESHRFCATCGARVPDAKAGKVPLSRVDFKHPLDAAATGVLSHTPGVDMLAKFISGTVVERLMNIELVGHAVRVDEAQYPQIYRLFLAAARRLHIRKFQSSMSRMARPTHSL